MNSPTMTHAARHATRRHPRHRRVHVAGAGARASRSTSARTSGRSAACCSRCSPAAACSAAKRQLRLWAVFSHRIASEELPDSVRPRVRRLIERCLNRDPRQRLRDIGDARAELADDADEEVIAGSTSQTGSRLPWLLAVVMTVVATVAFTLYLRGRTMPLAAEPITATLPVPTKGSPWLTNLTRWAYGDVRLFQIRSGGRPSTDARWRNETPSSFLQRPLLLLLPRLQLDCVDLIGRKPAEDPVAWRLEPYGDRRHQVRRHRALWRVDRRWPDRRQWRERTVRHPGRWNRADSAADVRERGR